MSVRVCHTLLALMVLAMLFGIGRLMLAFVWHL